MVKKLRGISINKIGVATAISEDMKSSFLIVTNTSKPSRKSTLNSYASHIELKNVQPLFMMEIILI